MAPTAYIKIYSYLCRLLEKGVIYLTFNKRIHFDKCLPGDTLKTSGNTESRARLHLTK